MSKEWISSTAERDNQVRVARLEQFENGIASFNVYDVRLEPLEEYQRTLVSEGYSQAEEIPDQYNKMDIFKVVSKDDGEFTIYSHDRFTGEITEGHTLGLQFDSDLNKKYKKYLEQL